MISEYCAASAKGCPAGSPPTPRPHSTPVTRPPSTPRTADAASRRPRQEGTPDFGSAERSAPATPRPGRDGGTTRWPGQPRRSPQGANGPTSDESGPTPGTAQFVQDHRTNDGSQGRGQQHLRHCRRPVRLRTRRTAGPPRWAPAETRSPTPRPPGRRTHGSHSRSMPQT